MATFGIDVSEFNGTLDYSKLKADGVKFVIPRAGYGQLESQKDVCFSQNMYSAINSGMEIGVYWMSYAWNVDTAIQEAELCAKFCNPYKSKITLPVFFDWEPDSYNYCIKKGVKPTKKLVTDMTLSFIKRIEELGYSGGYYTNESFYASFIDESRMKGKNLWIAFYVDRKPEKYDCMIQQYTDKGKLKGFSGVFDFDYLYTTTAEKPAQKPAQATYKTVTVTYGDFLANVAKANGVTVAAIEKANGVKASNKTGIKLKVPDKTIEQLAKEVLEGKWGVQPLRGIRLKNAGYDAKAVQDLLEKWKSEGKF